MEFLLAFMGFFTDFETDRIERRASHVGYGPVNVGYGPVNVGYGPVN